MKVELDKTGMVDLICGTQPDTDIAGRLEKKGYGYFCDNKWMWERQELKSLDNPKLWSLYKELRSA